MLLSSLSYLLCHCGREKHCLTVVGAQPDYFLHLFLKVFIQHPTQEKNSKVRQLHLVLAKKHYLRQGKDCCVAWEKSRVLPSHFSLLSCLAYLSASSKISTSTLLRWKEGQLWRWSISRPGVAIRMSGPERRAASWVFTSRPPERERTRTADSLSRLQQSTQDANCPRNGKQLRLIPHSRLEVTPPFLSQKPTNKKYGTVLESEILNHRTPTRSMPAITAQPPVL